MLEIVTWVILFSILAGCVIMIRYWIDLLKIKDNYQRNELIDFPRILWQETQSLSKEPTSAVVAAISGIILAFLLAMLGGLLSPDTGPEPDWASAAMPNYFFQSAISVLVFHLAWPSFKSMAHDSFAPDFLTSLLESDDIFFGALSISLATFSLTAWGVHHQMAFLFVLVNGLLLLFYAGYRFNLARENSNDFNSKQHYSDHSDDDDEF